MGRKIALPEGAEWIALDGFGSMRFYPVMLVGSVVLTDKYGTVWAELIDADSCNILFRTMNPMGRSAQIAAFAALTEESGNR
jgi:hypothetical protein